jgi:hypothetical protein
LASERPSWVHGPLGIRGRREPPTSSSNSRRADANLTISAELLWLYAGLRKHRHRTFVEAQIETPKFRATGV